MRAAVLLSVREIIQPLESDDSASVVLDQYHVVIDLFADRLLARIVEPDGQRIARPIVVNAYSGLTAGGPGVADGGHELPLPGGSPVSKADSSARRPRWLDRLELSPRPAFLASESGRSIVGGGDDTA